MSTDRKLTELLDVATTDVPAKHLAPPLTAIRGRVRRRRQAFVAVAAAAVIVVLAGGYSLGARMLIEPAPGLPVGPAPSPSALSTPALPWFSAMVARDDTTITVYASAKRCERLDRPRARIAAQNAARLTIEVVGRAVPTDDCSTGGHAVPIVVKLPAPLGQRTLLDAVGLRSHPTYFERYLPRLRADGPWSPVNTGWPASESSWNQALNGPGGAALLLRAQPTESVRKRVPVDSVDLGPYPGTITGNGAQPWTVWWQAGDTTYSLRLDPAEGTSVTLAQFKRKLVRLWA